MASTLLLANVDAWDRRTACLVWVNDVDTWLVVTSIRRAESLHNKKIQLPPVVN